MKSKIQQPEVGLYTYLVFIQIKKKVLPESSYTRYKIQPFT